MILSLEEFFALKTVTFFLAQREKKERTVIGVVTT